MKERIKEVFNKYLPTKKRKIIALIVLILLIIFIGRAISGGDEAVAIEKANKQVSVARVFDVVSGALTLPVVGTVESQSEATLRTQSSGEVSAVYKKIGDTVTAGTILAEINNSNERADVLRAQGVLQAAQANLSKVQGNSSENLALINSSIRQAFINADDAVNFTVFRFLEDTKYYTDEFDYGLYNKFREERPIVEEAISEWSKQVQNTSANPSVSELADNLEFARENLLLVQGYLDDIASAANSFDPVYDTITDAELDAHRAKIAQARSSVNTSLNTLLNSYNTISAQLSGGAGKGDDILILEAQVTQARAGLLSAQANLEKTIVRSPITGIVNLMTLQRGDFVSSFEEVSQVVGDGELEIVAYVNEADKERINVGTTVRIDNKWDGQIIRIAPAVNSTTQKVEIRVSAPKESKLSNGATVSLDINRNLEDSLAVNGQKLITIPISAVKITAEGSYVYKVNSENKVEAIEVTTGEILGERVVVEEGLNLSEIIILDSRGLKVGEEVTI